MNTVYYGSYNSASIVGVLCATRKVCWYDRLEQIACKNQVVRTHVILYYGYLVYVNLQLYSTVVAAIKNCILLVYYTSIMGKSNKVGLGL